MKINNIQKFLIIGILITLLINLLYSCYAFEVGTKKVKYIEDCGILLRYQGNDKLAHYAVFVENGIEYPAYCLNPEYYGVGSEGIIEYHVNGNEKLTNEKVWKVIINGYPYKSLEELGVENEKEAYTATQFAIYTVLHNRNPGDYTPVASESGRRTYQAYLKIVKDAESSEENLYLENNISISSIQEQWEIDANNTNYVSKSFRIENCDVEGEYCVKLIGNLPENIKITDIEGNEKSKFNIKEKFKVLVPLEKLTEDYEPSIQVIAKLKTKPVIFGKTTIEKTQNYALTGYINEEFENSIQEKVTKNNTKIKIIKQAEKTKERLEGVSFNLLNSTNDIVFQNIVTDKNGEINLEFLKPGLYYLQEINTLEEYNLSSEMIEINLEYNEEIEIIVNNSLKESEIIEENEVKIDYTKKLPVTGY